MNISKIKTYVQSRTFTTVVITIAVLAGVFIIFHAGVAVGYRRALFAQKHGDTFIRTFGQQGGGRGMGPGGMFSDESFGGHGAVGAILNITENTITVEDRSGIEKTINVTNKTIIKEYRTTVPLSKLTTGDVIVVLGTPNDTGSIDAKLIRILPDPSTLPMPTAQSPQ